jgi:hypothetical protein
MMRRGEIVAEACQAAAAGAAASSSTLVGRAGSHDNEALRLCGGVPSRSTLRVGPSWKVRSIRGGREVVRW